MPNDEIVNVRCMVDDVDEAITFYSTLLGFELLTSVANGDEAHALSATVRTPLPPTLTPARSGARREGDIARSIHPRDGVGTRAC